MTLTKQGAFTKKVTDLPNTPSPLFSPTEIKEHFQTPADELMVAHNSLVEELVAPSGAGELGAKDIDETPSTIQELLSKNANGLKGHGEATELDHPDNSVTTKKVRNGAITREKISNGAVGVKELDPSILQQPITEFGQQAKFQQLDEQLAEMSTNVKGKGDLISDDTQAFTNAIASLPNGGRILVPYTPTGYLIKNSIQLPSNIHLQGVGGRPTIKLASGTNQNAIQSYDTVNVTIENIHIEGNAEGQNSALYPSEHLNGVRMERVNGLTVKDVTVKNSLLENFYLKECTNLYIENCHGDGAQLDGWNINKCKDGLFVNVSAANITTSHTSNGNGFEIEDGCENLKFIGIRTKGNTITAGINIQHHPGTNTNKNITISKFISENDKMGIQIQEGENGTIISDFHIYGAYDGIQLINTESIIIEKGSIKADNRGIYSTTPISKTTIRDVTILPNTALYRAIDFQFGVTDLLIDGLDTSGATDYGIIFGVTDRIRLQNFNISSAKGVRFSSNATDLTLRDGLINSTTQYGLELRSTSINKALFDNLTIKSQQTGVRFNGSVGGNNIAFTNCEITAQTAFGVYFGGTNVFDNLYFINCDITTVVNSGKNYPLIHQAGGGTGVRYVNCTFDSVQSKAVEIQGGISNVQFLGGKVKSTGNGIEVGTAGQGTGAMSDIMIKGVYFESLNSCIMVESTASNNSQVKNLRVVDCDFKNSTYSIRWTGAQDPDIVTVTGCVLQGITTPYANPTAGTNIVKMGNNPTI
jgi:hypothetical protein